MGTFMQNGPGTRAGDIALYMQLLEPFPGELVSRKISNTSAGKILVLLQHKLGDLHHDAYDESAEHCTI